MPRYKPDHNEKWQRIVNDEYRRRNLHLGCFGLLLRSIIPLSVIFFFFWLMFGPKHHDRPQQPTPAVTNPMNPNTEEGREEIRRLAEEYRRNHPNAPSPSR